MNLGVIREQQIKNIFIISRFSNPESHILKILFKIVEI